MTGRVGVLLWKEWAELGRRRGLILTSLVPPLVFLCIALGLAAFALAAPELGADDDVPHAALEPLLRLNPALASLTEGQIMALFMVRQMMQFLLLPPVMTAMAVATHSIIGEKVNRSLEPLLSTPLTTLELLAGKALAAAIPAVALSYVTSAVYAGVLAAIAPPEVFRAIFDGTGICLLVLFAPLVAVLGLSLGVVVSSRASDPRSAQQIGVVVVLPVVGLFLAQLQGLFFLTPELVLAAAAVLAVVDVVILLAGVRLFERETILTRWK